jgi:hypothetical protein
LREHEYEGETMIVPVIEEVPVVEKRLKLTEELRITKRRIQHRTANRCSSVAKRSRSNE